MESSQQADRCALVVDDNHINRRVAAAMLRRIGFTHILEAEHGQEALALAKTSALDLILMDCEMPIMDGFEATRQIRNWEQVHNLPTCPILAVTARVQEGDEALCLSAGMNDYLSKPLQYETLELQVQKWTVAADADMTIESDIPPSTEEDLTPIDHARYEKMSLLLRDGIEEFYRDYLSATWEKLLQIQAEPEMPLEISARLIHSIRGSAANVGAQQLHGLAEKLERRLEDGEYTVLHQEIASLSQVFKRFEADIHERLLSR